MLHISIVISTHNNFTYKNGCLESVILAINNQININFETIIVDTASDEKNIKFLQRLHKKNPKIKVIYSIINNVSVGRNIGAKAANSELILFLDDDVLLPEKDILEQLVKQAKNKEYGLSATRLWTFKGWYQKNKKFLNEKITQKACDYAIPTSEPNPEVRRKKNDRHLIRTYIGNFGFIKKSALIDVGYWDEYYEGYGREDNAMAFKLYMKYGKPAILEELCVIHVWHEIAKEKYEQLEKNKKIFDRLLKENRIEKFHIGRILYNKDDVVEFIDRNQVNPST